MTGVISACVTKPHTIKKTRKRFIQRSVYWQIHIFLFPKCLFKDMYLSSLHMFIDRYSVQSFQNLCNKLYIHRIFSSCFQTKHHVFEEILLSPSHLIYIYKGVVYVCVSFFVSVRPPSTFQVFQLQLGSVRYCWKWLSKCFEVLNKIQTKTEPLKP